MFGPRPRRNSIDPAPDGYKFTALLGIDGRVRDKLAPVLRVIATGRATHWAIQSLGMGLRYIARSDATIRASVAKFDSPGKVAELRLAKIRERAAKDRWVGELFRLIGSKPKHTRICRRWLESAWNFWLEMWQWPGPDFILALKDGAGHYDTGNVEWRHRETNDDEDGEDVKARQ